MLAFEAGVPAVGLSRNVASATGEETRISGRRASLGNFRELHSMFPDTMDTW
jgi:hypothetical protein